MMRDGDHDRLPRFVARREGALRVLDRERGIAADEIEPLVAHQRAGKLPGFGEHLEAVADAEHGRAAVGGRDHRAADRRSEEHTSELQSLMRSSYAVF